MSAEVIRRLFVCFKTNFAKNIPKNMNKRQHPGLFLCRYATYLQLNNRYIVCKQTTTFFIYEL